MEKRYMLGNVIESALSKVGITEERVTRWLGKRCNCKARRDKFNQLHQWAFNVLAGNQQAIEADKRLSEMTGETTPSQPTSTEASPFSPTVLHPQETNETDATSPISGGQP